MNNSGAIMAGVLIFVVLIVLFTIVFSIMCLWKIYEKAGEPGWKCLVPIYNTWTLYKFIKMPVVVFWIALASSILQNIFSSTITVNGEIYYQSITSLGPVGTICAIISLIIYVMVSYKLSLAFGKGIGYTILLIFIIGYPMLAFGSAQYQYNSINDNDYGNSHFNDNNDDEFQMIDEN